MTDAYDQAIKQIEEEFPPGHHAVLTTPEGDRNVKIIGAAFAFDAGFKAGRWRILLEGLYEASSKRRSKYEKKRVHRLSLSITDAREALTDITEWYDKAKRT